MGRQENIEIFENTQYVYNRNAVLIQAIERANETQQLFREGDKTGVNLANQYEKPAEILVSKKRTLDAASGYAGKKVCILNFASATNPGGGVTKGSSAQEEAICRCSTLFPSLKEEKMWKGFYAPHRRRKNPLHNDDCIYTPGVVVFKSDSAYPQLQPEEDWYQVNVLTCAAPNLREHPQNGMNPGEGDISIRISREKLQQLHEKRMRRVLEIASAKGNEVVILGAFGCGAFCNPPETVAAAMKAVVQEYRHAFETIEFAVYCSPRDDSNYQVFQRVLGKM